MQEKTKLFLNRLALLQEKLLLSQADTLMRIQLSKAMLSFIRSEKHPPSVKVLRRLAQAEIAAGLETPVTGQTTMGELGAKVQRLGVPAAALYDEKYRAKRIKDLGVQIARDRELVASVQEMIALAEAELAQLKTAAKH